MNGLELLVSSLGELDLFILLMAGVVAVGVLCLLVVVPTYMAAPKSDSSRGSAIMLIIAGIAIVICGITVIALVIAL
jgi:hypothetical protein